VIGEKAVSGCSNLTSIVIPSNVKTIEDEAFSNCIQLINVTISDGVESIGNNIFSGCDNLTRVHIPSSVKTMEESALSGMINLLSIEVDESNPYYRADDGVLYTLDDGVVEMLMKYPPGRKTMNYDIPGTVKSIGNGAFDGCDELITVNIPSSVMKIGLHSFSGLSKLTFINVSTGNSVYESHDGVLFDAGEHVLVKCPEGKNGNYVIPDGTTAIGGEAFKGCRLLSNVIIPDGIMSIEAESFYGCSNLMTINIPSSVEVIGTGAFDECYNLVAINVDENNEYYESIDGVLLDDNNTINHFPRGKSGDYMIPDGVILIEAKTFKDSHSLTSVTIPYSVSAIENKAFSGCTSLTSINVNETNTYFKSIDGVLFSHDGNTLIEYPEGLEGRYDIPYGTTVIGVSAFEWCTKLSSVTIPTTVEKIYDDAFDGCSGLEELTIEDGVSTIGYSSFSGCSKLTSLTIPSSVELISDYAFSFCENLEVVSYFGVCDPGWYDSDHAFEGCDKLHHVCVPKRFYSLFFCDRRNFCSTDSCESLQFDIDHCHEYSCFEGDLVAQERKNSTDWEKRSNACVEYICDDEIGGVLRTLCKSDQEHRYVCMNDGCLELETDRMRVEINVENLRVDDFDSIAIVEYIKRGLTDVDIEVELELDNDGYIMAIIIPVDDEQTGLVVAGMVNACSQIPHGDE